MLKAVMAGVAAATLGLAAMGCDNPNKQNDTGEEIQEAAEKTGDAVEHGAAKAARALEQGARKVGDQLEEGANDAEEKIDDSAADPKEQKRESDRAAGSVQEVPPPEPARK